MRIFVHVPWDFPIRQEIKMPSVTHSDQDIPDGVERAVLSNGEAIAEVYFLRARHDMIVVWPLIEGVALCNVLEAFSTSFLQQTRPSFSGAQIEFWIGDDYTNETVGEADGYPRDLTRTLDRRSKATIDDLDLLRLTLDGLCLELTFSEKALAVDRVAVAASDFDTTALATFFAALHNSDAIHSDKFALGSADFSRALRPPPALIRTVTVGAASQG